MHLVYKAMKRHKVADPVRLENLTMRHFVDRAMKATGVSRPTIYRYVERADALIETLGPVTLKAMLSGDQPIVNDEDTLLKVAQLPATKALKVANVYMRGGKSEAAAARLVERYIHEYRLAGLTNTHEPRLRGGSLVNGTDPPEPEPIGEERNVVYFGDALLRLQQTIRPESAQVCVTSPPFFGQRDLGTRHWLGCDPGCRHDRKVTHGPFHDGQVAQTKYRTAKASQDGQTAITHSCSKCGGWLGQLGQEADVSIYVDHLVAIFREVRHALRSDGVAWVEIGDTYNAYNGNRGASSSISRRADHARPRWSGGHGLTVSNIPNKSLLLVPQRLAVALSDDGWIVRSEVIWHKTAGLPESCHDRPTRAHTTILIQESRVFL
jgi:DNA modification methylase